MQAPNDRRKTGEKKTAKGQVLVYGYNAILC